ncbi:MAG: transposase [Methylococcales bacterium]|nr:transposase [Methylococcales bacterium]
MLAWAAKHHADPGELHAILESTGVYHEQAALALPDAGFTVSIAKPAQVKDFGRSLGIRTKTDRIDSFVFARYGALLNPRAWAPPAQEARTLQALLPRREAIAQDLQRERNRLETVDVTDTPPLIRHSLVDSMTFLENQLAKLQQEIDDHINKPPA